MRILLDQAAHDMRNKGNNALLHATIDQLRRLWPDAVLDVVTLAPTLTKMYFPDLGTVHPHDLRPLHGYFDRYLDLAPHTMWWLPFELRESLWHHWPALMPAQFGRALRARLPGRSPGDEDAKGTSVPARDLAEEGDTLDKSVLEKAIAAYDLVVAVGGGYLCDADRPMLLQVLEHLEAAIAQSVPTVMVGQGVGPLENPELRERASAVLPFVDLIFVRERRIAPALLARLGVPANRVMMTGDDAVEMVFTARTEAPGLGIGVSLRVTPYTALGNDHMPVIRAAVQHAARKYHSELIALPISSAPHESDIKHIRRLMAGYAPSYISRRRLGTPSDTIRQTARCRVVVTGTFHGAVFALAQGIPVVALARSTEYVDKLTGLADEFGSGCQVVRLDGPGLDRRLGAAIDNAWASADAVRADLLENATRLVGLRQTAYQRLKALGPRRQRPPGPYHPQPPGRRGTDELRRL